MEISDWYLQYLTLIIFIIGFIIGVSHVFSIMASYQSISEYGYNEICRDTFGKSYYFEDYNSDTTAISCSKESNLKVSLKRIIFLN